MAKNHIELNKEQYLLMLQGIDIYPWIKIALAEKFKMVPISSTIRFARVMKMRTPDFIIDQGTKKIRNNKLARELNKDRIIKDYKDTDKFIRVLKE